MQVQGFCLEGKLCPYPPPSAWPGSIQSQGCKEAQICHGPEQEKERGFSTDCLTYFWTLDLFSIFL